jgi:hypothetical protein
MVRKMWDEQRPEEEKLKDLPRPAASKRRER